MYEQGASKIKITGLRRIIRRKDLPKYTGLQRSQTNTLIARGEFPKPISLADGGRAKGWLEDDLIAWQEARINAPMPAISIPRKGK
jgi:predicted DNA-binding transcriptional regulator AlpA